MTKILATSIFRNQVHKTCKLSAWNKRVVRRPLTNLWLTQFGRATNCLWNARSDLFSVYFLTTTKRILAYVVEMLMWLWNHKNFVICTLTTKYRQQYFELIFEHHGTSSVILNLRGCVVVCLTKLHYIQ